MHNNASHNDSIEFVKLFGIILLLQYISLVGMQEIEAFVELDKAYKENEVSRVTSKSIHETQIPADQKREVILQRLKLFQVDFIALGYTKIGSKSG